MNNLSKEIILSSNNWHEFKFKLKNLNNKDKGSVFEDLCFYYFKTEPKYINSIVSIWSTNNKEIPPKILSYLNHPINDEGIDFILETKNNKYWAVQCKYHENQDINVKREDLGTFFDLSFRICRNIELAITFTSSYDYSYKFDKYSDKSNVNNISFITGNAIEKISFERIQNLINDKKTIFKEKQKANHQIVALNKLKDFISKDSKRGQIIHPCGTGKSLTSFWISEFYKPNTIIVAVPSLSLLNQTLNVWALESVATNWMNNFIIVCSDEKASKTNDELASTRLELGVKCTEDVDEICSFLISTSDESKIILTTYQSSEKVCTAFKKINLKCDLAILDEAHRTVGSKGKLFTKLLFDENIEIKKRIFFTATPKIYNGSSDKFFGMEDENIYGYVIDELSFAEALTLKRPDGSNIICDYNIVTFTCSSEEIVNLIGKNRYLEITEKDKSIKEIEAHSLACAIGLRKLKQSNNVKKTITFHSNLARAKSFSQNQKHLDKYYTELDSYYIEGSYNTRKRNLILQSFKESKDSIISNARCLNEGVDIESVDSILFADPRNSLVDVVQACGRALRPYKNKKIGYIFIPIFLNENDTDSEKLKNAFSTVASVVNQIGSFDSRLEDYFTTISRGKKWNGKKIITFLNYIESLEINFEEFSENISLEVAYRFEGLRQKPLNEEVILQWCDDFFNKKNEYPIARKYLKDPKTAFNYKIEGTSLRAVDSAFYGGYRGLKDYGGLKRFLIHHKRISDDEVKIELSENIIVNLIKNYFSIHKKYPTAHSGQINKNTNWNQINTAGRLGLRGLKKGTTLAFIISKYFKPDEINWLVTNYTKNDIKIWIQEYFDEHGDYPNVSSKERVNKKRPKWVQIDKSLVNGRKDKENKKKGEYIIKPGSSLKEFLYQEFNFKRTTITLDLINELLDYEFQRFNEYPDCSKPAKINHPKYKNLKNRYGKIYNWKSLSGVVNRDLKMKMTDILFSRGWSIYQNGPIVSKDNFKKWLKNEIIQNGLFPNARHSEIPVYDFPKYNWARVHADIKTKQEINLRDFKATILKELLHESGKSLEQLLKKDVYDSLIKSQSYRELKDINKN